MLSICLSLIDSESDRSQFEKIYYAYRKQMFFLAQKLTEDDSISEDIVHDVFYCIAQRHMKKVMKIKNEKDLRNYLLKATKNAALNYIDKAKREIPADELFEAEKEFSDREFLEKICRENACEAVLSAIRELDRKYCDVLYYHFVLGFTAKEIAEELDRNLQTVKKQLVRGKSMLLKNLKENGVTKDVI